MLLQPLVCHSLVQLALRNQPLFLPGPDAFELILSHELDKVPHFWSEAVVRLTKRCSRLQSVAAKVSRK